jgi:hypothetical protein
VSEKRCKIITKGKEYLLKRRSGMKKKQTVEQAVLIFQATSSEIELIHRLEAIDPECMPGHRWALLEKIAYVNDIERCGYDYVVDMALQMTDKQLKAVLDDMKGQRL